ncbi:MAG TPA: hypothetical protein VFP54_08030 [Acidimicrobiales bacterium]|nr:hypothetical protein [Acidimicrobiales bacterium]
MTRLDHDLQPAEQPDTNRLVVGDRSLKIEQFEPLGDVMVQTPSGTCCLHYAATARVLSSSGPAVVLFGEMSGHLLAALSG